MRQVITFLKAGRPIERRLLGLALLGVLVVLALGTGRASSNTGQESLSGNPTTNLPDTGLTTVAVSGSSFVGGAGVQLQECSSVPGTGLCVALVDLSVGQNGAFSTNVQVSYDMHGNAPSSGPFCDTSPSATCDLEAVYTNGETGVGATTPLTFAGHVSGGNVAPVADDQSVSTDVNAPVQITLTANDANGDSLTYAVVAGPSNGGLSGTAPNLTYTPGTDFKGVDSFTFKANDGLVDSNTATVSIAVESSNDAPVAHAQTVQTAEDTPLPVLLTADDPNNDPLTYAVVDQPSSGTLSGTPPNLAYTPNANFNGSDSFTFLANDGILDSNLATVSVSVTPVNDPPSVSPFSLTTQSNKAVTVTLSASDPDSPPSAISYAVVQSPQHGTAAISGAQLTYTPAKGYTGPDSLTYIASDGQASSSAAAVSITVTQGNSGQPKGKGGGGYTFECLVNTGAVTASSARPRIVGAASAICWTVPVQGIAFPMIFKAHLQVFKKGAWVSIATKVWTQGSSDYVEVPAYLKASCTSGQTKLYRVIGRVTTPYDTGVVAGASTSLTCS